MSSISDCILRKQFRRIDEVYKIDRNEVEKVKKRKASELKQGQRRFRRVMRGYGGFPRPKPEGREKTSRRTGLRYNCSKCHKMHQPPSIRSKKFELGE